MESATAAVTSEKADVRLSPSTTSRILGRVGATVLALGVLTVVLEATDVLESHPFGVALPLFALMGLPITAFVVAYQRSAAFRQFVLSIDLRMVVLFQVVRLAGMGFLILYASDKLPAGVAMVPALADFVVAYTALVIAFWWLSHPSFSRRGFIAWNLFGIGDFVATAVVFLLVRYDVLYPSTGDWAGLEQLTELPLGLLPAFMVPLAIIMHVIAILQVRGMERPRVRPLLVTPES